VKLDLGCGTQKKEGYIGVDSRAFDGVDVVCNLGADAWPWQDDTVDDVHCSHMVEHLTAPERIHFVNELYRVLRKGAKAQIITPHWNSNRAYGDLTHQWPPVSEMWFYYLSAEWRKTQAPHNDQYSCDFEATWGYGMHPALAVRNAEYQQFALNNYREAAQDLHATLTKR
jgi:SAM-dependent methyltransferase